MSLYENINKKRKSGRKMRKKGDKGAPTEQNFADAAKTAKAMYGGKMKKEEMMYGGMMEKKKPMMKKGGKTKAGLKALTKMVYSQVYSKIKGIPPLATFDNRDKRKTTKLIDKLPRKKSDDMYNQYLEIVRQSLIKRFNKNKIQSMKYIKDAILREAPDVPTMVIKAVGRDYEEVTDRDELGVFLPQVQFIKAKPSKTSKQNFLLELKSRNEKVTLMMTVRSSSGGKLKQFSLKVTYNGIVK